MAEAQPHRTHRRCGSGSRSRPGIRGNRPGTGVAQCNSPSPCGHVFPVAKSPGVYRVIGGLVGTYKIRSERVIQGWTYWTTQISELADEALSALEEDLQRRSSGLTAREVDILDLVANGLSNAEIAERLVLSERTVHAHLRSIFDKLGVNTRTAAVHEASWLFANR